MSSYLFDQLAFVRGQTLQALQDVPEEAAAAVPEGFRNSIQWQAGHIYLAQERFAFVLQGQDGDVPPAFPAWFGAGSSPAAWTEPAPALAELRERLRAQQERIAARWKGRLHEGAPAPYTTSTGLTLATTEAFLQFTLYHEGMHFQAIKMYKAMLLPRPRA
ncbi:DinB family protein [Paenibacillus sp.]|uniref:DinB family protein n=1 Tax=Paenibacillus sp. TaxID=58172 RepID=UPI002D56311F|nr:DinB family protein [Paenibacillus sp.]HZG57913.1 DinB family protein [Paenibacillus sp.]